MSNCITEIYKNYPETFARIKSECQKFMNIEVRLCLGNWIEENLQNTTDPGLFYVNFLKELRRFSSEKNDLIIGNRFEETIVSIENHYGPNPYQLYYDLTTYLNTEKELCDQIESDNAHEINKMNTVINELMKKCSWNNHCVSELQRAYESLRIDINDFNNVNSQFDEIINNTDDAELYQQARDAELNRLKIQANKMKDSIVNHEPIILRSFEEVIETVDKIAYKVIENHLVPWQAGQMHFLNEKESPVSKLDLIQNWFESLIEILVHTRNQFSHLDNFRHELMQQNGIINDLNVMNDKCQFLLGKLISHSLVFEKQPDRIIKTDTKFAPKVRLLIGKCINAGMSHFNVEMSLISAENAQEIKRTGKIPNTLNEGSLANNQKSLVFKEQTRVCEADFKQMVIKSRPKQVQSKGDTEGIVERPTALLARVKINYNGIFYDLFQLSTPIIIIVHKNQDAIAWSTAIWDSIFCSPNDPFTKVEEGSWHVLAEALDLKFKKEVTRGLTEENLEFLYWKLTSKELQKNSNPTVTWTQFAKEKIRPLPTYADKDCFTFWEWIYSNLKLILHHFSGMWQNYLIDGFVHKHGVQSKLKTCKDGTFILRFSDSLTGAITAAFVQNGEVKHITPNTHKELEACSLTDRLNALNDLQFFYPNHPKRTVVELYQEKKLSKPLLPDYIPPIFVGFLSFNDVKSPPYSPQSSMEDHTSENLSAMT